MQNQVSNHQSGHRSSKLANFFGVTLGKLIAVAGLVLLASCGGSGGGGTNAPSASTSTSTKAITAFSLAGVAGTINEANKSIAVTMPFGTNVTPLVATFTTTGNSVAVGATAQISGTTANSFASPVIYTVTAADGSTINYTVTVTVAPSTAKALTAFSLAGVAGTINETNKTIAVTIQTWVSKTALVSTFTTTGASVKIGTTVQTSGTTANNFTTPVTYTVTAADGTTVSYTVTVTYSPLNDTGITASQCYQTGSDVLVSCSSAGAIALNAQQDGMVGRDANPLTNSNADGRLGFSFTALNGGCVKDNVSGLVWEVKTTDGGLRDWNKTYTNQGTGLATDASGYMAAVNATALCGYSDWRLPTVDELQGIVDYSVVFPSPTIDTTWFPNTTMGWYWASTPYTPYAANAGLAWIVDFVYGSASHGTRALPGGVRLVRGAVQSHQFTVSVDGQEVTDNYTGLIWRRCSEGQTWNGTTCSGTALIYTHEQALARAQTQTGWRLPNVKELASIADRTRANPAIDPTAFPGAIYGWLSPIPGLSVTIPGVGSVTIAGGYWASTPDASYTGNAWGVDFDLGDVGSNGRSIQQDSHANVVTYYVRLVR